MSPRVLILWNPSARRASRQAALARWLERQDGVVVRQTTSRTQARLLARAAAARGVPLVLAAGGDGSAAAAAMGLVGAGSRTRLGLLPLGSANDLARLLGVPLDPREAFDAQLGCRSRRMDVLELTHDRRRRVVLNVVAIGNGAVVSEGASRATKRRWGHWAYLRSAAHVIRSLQRWEIDLRRDEGSRERRSILTFVVANGPRSAGGIAVAPGAEPFDGLLDVVSLQDAPPTEIAAVIARLLLADEMRGDHVISWRGSRVRLLAREPMPLAADGDPLPAALRIDVRVRKAALRVVALR